MKLMAQVGGKWFEVFAFYSEEHPHMSFKGKGDMVWLLEAHGIQSGFVDFLDVQEFKVFQDEAE